MESVHPGIIVKRLLPDRGNLHEVKACVSCIQFFFFFILKLQFATIVECH